MEVFAAGAGTRRGCARISSEWSNRLTRSARGSRKRLFLFPLRLAPCAFFPRGNWQDDSGEVVGPATPASLPAAPIADRQKARLDLARWMVAPDNPLVSRVFVNRLWKLFFGEGIVRTLGDFGTQGQWPTHPELLDWLAVELRDGGWDVKRLIKLIVMSRTYQQSSMASHELRQRDPNNRLLARQSPFRLDAEFVRDNALAVSGLLVGEDRRSQRETLSTRRILALSQLSAARMATGPGRTALSPRAVYALAAHLSAPQPGGFRRPQPRRMHGRAPAIQHAAAGPRAAERPDLRRGCASTGRPRHSGGGRLRTGPIALRFSARREPRPDRKRKSQFWFHCTNNIANNTGKPRTTRSRSSALGKANRPPRSTPLSWPPGRPSRE